MPLSTDDTPSPKAVSQKEERIGDVCIVVYQGGPDAQAPVGPLPSEAGHARSEGRGSWLQAAHNIA